MPRTTRSSKSTAPSPAPLSHVENVKAQETLDRAVEVTGIDVEPEVEQGQGQARDEDEKEEMDDEEEVIQVKGKGKGKGKGKASDDDDEAQQEDEGTGKRLSAEERVEKLKALRMRMNQSTAANRSALITDSQARQTTQRELARLTKQKKLADNLREKIDAEENGVDKGRKNNWRWTIEQNQAWVKGEEEKGERGKVEFDDRDSNAQRTYDKDTRKLKPDLVSYNRQKELALGLAPGTIVPIQSKGSGLSTASSSTSKALSLSAMEDLYRDGNTLSYGDNKASDDAIDRVVGKINADTDKRNKAARKRKLAEGDDGDVTYINDANKVFNRKINRYFDKYTTEIRANFERGTAL